MAETTRVSALAGNYRAGRFGNDADCGVTLREIPDLRLTQIAAWPDTVAHIAARAADCVGLAGDVAPGPCRAVTGPDGDTALLRVEPLKWWLLGAEAPALDADRGVTLDLSHSRTRVLAAGEQARTLLNRHLPLNLYDDACPVGTVMSTAFHHVGVTLWRSERGFELFLPRGFALSLWELLAESAAQFGYRVG